MPEHTLVAFRALTLNILYRIPAIGGICRRHLGGEKWKRKIDLTPESAIAYVEPTIAEWGYKTVQIDGTTMFYTFDGVYIDVRLRTEHGEGVMSVWTLPDGSLYGEW